MRLDDERESSNFEVQGRGGGGLGFGGGGGNILGMLLPLIGSRFGCGGIVVVLAIMFFMGLNPLSLLGGGAPVQQQAPTSTDKAQLTDVQRWSLRVLASTEDTWGPLFQRMGRTYQPTVLSFYSQSGSSGCGAAQSAMGPFYCPTDQKVYLDTDFFNELSSRFGAAGDFAQAYVIAHEVGHHVQTLVIAVGFDRKARSSRGDCGRTGLAIRGPRDLTARH